MKTRTPSTTTTSRKPKKIELPRLMPPKIRPIAWTMPVPTASRAITMAMIKRMPRIRATMPALAGGISSPIIRSMNSWRPEGACWPSFSIASLRSSGRRSACASEAFISWRSAGRSRGLQPTSASLK
jgi:hypothetical protein